MSDRPDLIVSEMGGVAFSSVDQCFRFCDLKRMFDMPVPMSLEWNTPFFVCIDPCAGGEHSDFALVSFVYVHGAYQVFLSLLFPLCVCRPHVRGACQVCLSLSRALFMPCSCKHDKRLEAVEDVAYGLGVLACEHGLEEPLVHNRRKYRHCHVGVEGLEGHQLPEERVVVAFVAL